MIVVKAWNEEYVLDTAAEITGIVLPVNDGAFAYCRDTKTIKVYDAKANAWEDIAIAS
jgi:hypothetical protein